MNMQANANVGIHNKFVVTRKDVVTGIEEEVAVAYNIVLDKYLTLLASGTNVIFQAIAFGSGTGMLDVTRTTLFSLIGYKSATVVSSDRAFPVSSITRKVVINPEEYVGSTFREVGISTGGATIVTHAMLKDSDGNPVAITKSATDVITIYATLYVDFGGLTISGLGDSHWCEPAANNPFVKYMLSEDSFPSMRLAVGEMYDDGGTDQPAPGELGRMSSNLSFTADAANFRRVAAQFIFDVSTGNGQVGAIGAGNYDVSPYWGIFRLKVPGSGIWPGATVADLVIGVGDGVKKDFSLPYRKVSNLSIKKAGLPVSSGVVLSNEVDAVRDSAVRVLAGPYHSSFQGSVGHAIHPSRRYVGLAYRSAPWFIIAEIDPLTLRTVRTLPYPEVVSSHAPASYSYPGGVSFGQNYFAVTVGQGAPAIYPFNPNTGVIGNTLGVTPSGLEPTEYRMGLLFDGSVVWQTRPNSTSYFNTNVIANGVIGPRVANLSGSYTNYPVRPYAASDGSMVLCLGENYYVAAIKVWPDGTASKVQGSWPGGVGEFAGGGVTPDGTKVIAAWFNGGVYYRPFDPVAMTFSGSWTQLISSPGNNMTKIAFDDEGHLLFYDGSGWAMYLVNWATMAIQGPGALKPRWTMPHNSYFSPDLSLCVQQTTGFWPTMARVGKSAGKIYHASFAEAPAVGEQITATFDVPFIPKDANHTLAVQFSFQFGRP